MMKFIFCLLISFFPLAVIGRCYTVFFIEYGLSIKVSDNNIRLHGVLRNDTVFVTMCYSGQYIFSNNDKNNPIEQFGIEKQAIDSTTQSNINARRNKRNKIKRHNGEVEYKFYEGKFCYKLFMRCRKKNSTKSFRAFKKICASTLLSDSAAKLDVCDSQSHIYYHNNISPILPSRRYANPEFKVSYNVPLFQFDTIIKRTTYNGTTAQQPILDTSMVKYYIGFGEDKYVAPRGKPFIAKYGTIRYWADVTQQMLSHAEIATFQSVSYYYPHNNKMYILTCGANILLHPDYLLEFNEIANSVRFDDE